MICNDTIIRGHLLVVGFDDFTARPFLFDKFLTEAMVVEQIVIMRIDRPPCGEGVVDEPAAVVAVQDAHGKRER